MNEERELVKRLRAMAGPIVPNVCTEAADEIERLRVGGCVRDQRTTQYCAEAVRLQAERDEATREVQTLERNAETTYENHKQIVAELTAERDEARRIACAYFSGTYRKDRVILDRAATLAEAKRRGWDCFKEDGK
jgi:hypothetical protein